MNLDTFISVFKDKAVDFDDISGVQCVDTAKMYFYYVLGIKPQIIGNANEYADRYYELPYLYENFEYIPYHFPFTPEKGDVAVWNTTFGKYGHIAICTGEGNWNEFCFYEQNGDVKELVKRCSDYFGVEGFLRPRNKKLI